jgi:hypothetical protein
MFTATCFGRFLLTTSGSFSLYIKGNAYQVEGSPLQAVDTTLRLKLLFQTAE